MLMWDVKDEATWVQSNVIWVKVMLGMLSTLFYIIIFVFHKRNLETWKMILQSDGLVVELKVLILSMWNVLWIVWADPTKPELEGLHSTLPTKWTSSSIWVRSIFIGYLAFYTHNLKWIYEVNKPFALCKHAYLWVHDIYLQLI